MNTAQLEYLLRQVFTSLLEAKEAMWAEDYVRPAMLDVDVGVARPACGALS